LPATVVKSGADMGKDGAALVKVGCNQVNDARVSTRKELTNPQSIGTLPWSRA
jgi:hypothetical protein